MSTRQNYKNSQKGPKAASILGIILSIVYRFQTLRLILIKVGEVLSHRQIIETKIDSYDKSLSIAKFRHSRESVWKEMSLFVQQESIFFEFGVAQGYLTNWWLKKCKDSSIEWHGFDTFKGLPEKFRNLPAGTFSNNGFPPPLHDKRVRFHIGDVKSNFKKGNLILLKPKNKVFFFDLDLFDPSKHVWEVIEPHIKVGDIVYFDEAFDESEYTLIHNFVLPAKSWRVLAFSWTSLALVAT